MQCKSCGKKICEGARFCEHCGAKAGEPVPKRWQPANILIGVAILGLAASTFLTPILIITIISLVGFAPMIVGAFVLILTRRNNFIAGSVLLILAAAAQYLGNAFFPMTGLSVLAIKGTTLMGGLLDLPCIAFLAALLLTVLGGTYVLASASFIHAGSGRCIPRSLAIAAAITVCVGAAIILTSAAALPQGGGPGGQGQPQTYGGNVTAAAQPGITILLLNATGPPQPDFIKDSFAVGEVIFPQKQGLKKGDRYGFRVVYPNGTVAVPLFEQSIAEVGSDGETGGIGEFNSQQSPLAPGNYTMELLKVDGANALVVASANFSVYAGTAPGPASTGGTTTADTCPTGLEVGLAKEEFGQQVATSFLRSDGIYPEVKSPTDCLGKMKVTISDTQGNVVMEKAFNIPAGMTGYGDYNPARNLAPGEYRAEFLYDGVLFRMIEFTVA